MTIHKVSLIYGVIVSFKDLKKTGLLPPKYCDETIDDNDIDENDDNFQLFMDEVGQIGNLKVEPCTHDILNNCIEHGTVPNLVDSFEDCYFVHYPVIGQPMKSVGKGSNLKWKNPTFEVLQEMKEGFEKNVTPELLAISGKPGYHWLTDDCSCCS